MPVSRARWLGVHLFLFSFGFFTSLASAQTANTVLLESLDKSVSVSGELIEAANGQYRLRTIAGVVAVDVDTVRCVGEACPLVVREFERGAEVILTSDDGAVNISGTITDIVDDQYVVENAVVGSVQIELDLVECTGPGCPRSVRFADELDEQTEAPSVTASPEVERDTSANEENAANEEKSAVEADTTNDIPAVEIKADTTTETPTVEDQSDTSDTSDTNAAQNPAVEADAVTQTPETDTETDPTAESDTDTAAQTPEIGAETDAKAETDPTTESDIDTTAQTPEIDAETDPTAKTDPTAESDTDTTAQAPEIDAETDPTAQTAAAETNNDTAAQNSEADTETTAEPTVTEAETTAQTVEAEADDDTAADAAVAELEADTTAEVPMLDGQAETESEVAATDAEATVEAETVTDPIDPSTAQVSFAGSDTVGLGLLPFLLEDYAETLQATAETTDISDTETFVSYIGTNENELGSMYFNATKSGDAVEALATKSAVFAMTSRQIGNDEANQLIAAGLNDLRNSEFETVIAADSLAVITHPSNPVSELSMQELGDIYLGQIENWSQVGGPNLPITVLAREAGSGTRSIFESIVFDDAEPDIDERVSYLVSGNDEMAASVNNDPLAIGYASLAFTDGLNSLDLRSECGITSAATSFSVKAEEYPLARRLYLYHREDNATEEAKSFLNFVLSPNADDAITKSNFVNFAVERAALDPSRYQGLQEGRNEESMAQLTDDVIEDLGLWDRFSTTVRFPPGSFILGRKELNDIDRLVDTLSDLPEGTQIAAVGVTDNVDSFADNLRLSRLRVQTVADAISSIARERALKVEIDTRYFSDLSPSVCDFDANGIGKAINRRVEIWVRR